ncbi:MAG TPA: PilZ domain-containing protein [Candidatus Acidoferrales bacterium]|jgi:hypothetical protein|nr:PilZ domain-containing protein [Candidatus Acidoferrales bacterium]
MTVQNVRQSDRAALSIEIEALGSESDGREFIAPGRTLLISRTGAAIVIDRQLAPGQILVLRRRTHNGDHQEARVRVVAEIGPQPEGRAYGVAILDPGVNFWGVQFPDLDESEQAVARIVVQCMHCQIREVAYLSERELLEFETHQAVARYCPVCGFPALWTQAPQASEEKTAAKEDPSAGPTRQGAKARLKTILSACVRIPGEADEMAVCENVSRGGVCFRSRRKYEPGTQITVAFPFRAEGANIFVAARVVHCQEIRSAGLFRHGVAYVSQQSETRAN